MSNRKVASAVVCLFLVQTLHSVSIGPVQPRNITATEPPWALAPLEPHRTASTATNISEDTTGLVAHWRLDEGDGSSAWDEAGGHTGMLANGAAWAAGYHGGGVSFDGVNDYIALPVIDVAGSAVTIAAWAKSASFGEQRFISKASARDEQSHYWMLSQFNDGQPRLRFRLKAGGTTTTLIASTGTLPRDTWYHVAATYDGAAMRLYLNGVQVGAVAKSGALNTSSAVPVNIGRNPDGTNHLHG